jgi:GNAT superfamily N-acetyltransferase
MEIRQLGNDRLKEAGSILSDAFWNYEEVLHLLPDEARRARVLPRYLTADCVDAIRFGTLFGAFHDNALVGVSAWLPPGGYPESIPRRMGLLLHVLPVLPFVVPVVPEVLRSQKAKTAGHTHEPHVYLCVLGVSRRLQSSGAGTALVDAMVQEADEHGVGCYLTTATESNVSWYGRFGFGVIEEFRPTPCWPTVWRMWRKPR